MSVTLFGIRHHGPGCARSLVAALDALSPEVLLIEMPHEAESLLEHAAHEAMKPPVAILIHRTDDPQVASFYPFAEFSPEWQALRWALGRRVPVRCIDLPSANQFALREEFDEPRSDPDPFEWFARADGYTDGERWWNDRVEERRDQQGFFEAILEAVAALRGDLDLAESRMTLLREAWMRKCMRAAAKDGFERIAVVCGAWHAPALQEAVKISEDNALLKSLPKHKTAATWIPWTDDRLAMASGYAAGIRSPGWYGHLWRHREDPIPSWLARAARLLRKHGQEASSASVIEAVRLANALAGMRGRPLPGFDETMEAIQAIFCAGDPVPIGFLRKPLVIGERMGELPEGLPTLPLQTDIEAFQRKLRLKPVASSTPLELDLREDGGRARSVFLHRLIALEIGWGRKVEARGRGTFKEGWVLQWKPELAVAVIDASAFGNTVESAACARLVKPPSESAELADVTEALDLALLGELPAAVGTLLRRLDDVAASTMDVPGLMSAVPSLARIARYGDVRGTDGTTVLHLLGGLAGRIHAGLVLAGSGIDDAAAALVSAALQGYSSALSVLEEAGLIVDFHTTLVRIADGELVHAMLRGHAVRILRDAGSLARDVVSRHLAFSLSQGMSAGAGAAWLQGFLRDGGSLLVHDHELLGLVDGWLSSLDLETFQATLPLLRRTFGGFSIPERERIASTLAHQPCGGAGGSLPMAAAQEIDRARALPAVAAMAKLLEVAQPS